jgi:hypothetical protein
MAYIRKCINEECRKPLVRRETESEKTFMKRIVCSYACRLEVGRTEGVYVERSKRNGAEERMWAPKRKGPPVVRGQAYHSKLDGILARIAAKRNGAAKAA